MAKKKQNGTVKFPTKKLQEAYEAVVAAYKKAGITMEMLSDAGLLS